MGRGFIEYDLPDSGRTEFVAYSAYLTYRLPDGSSLSIDQKPGWCPVCDRFVLVELLPSVGELEQTLAAIEARDPYQLRVLEIVGRAADDEVMDLARRIQWRRTRVSPARCLKCGCDDILPLPAEKAFAHPSTGEPVVETSSGFASMERWVAEFNPEGLKSSNPAASGTVA